MINEQHDMHTFEIWFRPAGIEMLTASDYCPGVIGVKG
jgi:hypothetical protein